MTSNVTLHGPLFAHSNLVASNLTTLSNAVFRGRFSVSNTAFFTSNWEEYHIKIMRTSQNGIGITELQLLLIGVMLMQAISGGKLSEITMRNFGSLILPTVDE
jgi:hypothetical protein